MLIYLHFLQVSPPPPLLQWQWRWEEGREYDLTSVSRTPSSSRAQSDSSSTYGLVKKHRREQNILLTAFPRKESRNYIFGFLCITKRYVYVSAFFFFFPHPRACEGMRVGILYVSVSFLSALLYRTISWVGRLQEGRTRETLFLIRSRVMAD